MPDATIIFSFLGGGILGVIIGHWFTKSRDRDHRRIRFIGFMGQWRSEIQDSERPLSDFADKVHVFMGEAAQVRRDIRLRGNRKVFDAFCDSVKRVGPHIKSEYKGEDYRALTLRSVDAVVRFFDRTWPDS